MYLRESVGNSVDGSKVAVQEMIVRLSGILDN